METTEKVEEQEVPSALEEKESAPPVIERHFTIPLNGKHPAQETNWIDRIVEGAGQPERLSVPAHWSERSISIAYKHYMSAVDQHSIKRMLSRVYTTITNWGIEDGVFETETEAQVFEEELAYVLLNRLGTFNSPVWYNMGVEKHPLLNACFLNSVEDCSESITDLACKEVNIFKWGAGTGCNWSKLRSSKEKVRGGGNASGPVSFMIANDVEASKWKSGGKHRRAARLDRLDVHHPDVLEFIEVKRHYENMVRALVKAGWSTDMNDPLSTSNTVPMQSTNISVGLSDVFLNAVENDDDWPLVLVTTGEVYKVVKARAVMRLIAECAHDCGDPGVQYSDTINQWSFIKDIATITTANPCGEVFNADNVSCNLANMNLLPSDNIPMGDDDIIQISKLFTTALDIMLDHGRYPAPIIEETTKAFRPLGVGWCNLGAAILVQGWPYDSREGRLWASHVTSLTTVAACQQSMKMAKRRGPFTSAEKCSDSTSHVLRKHLEHAPDQITRALWQDLCLEFNKGNLLRNSALTCAMPTGTTGLLLDAETTGPEPLVNLEVSKKLSYGGKLTLTARCLSLGLKKLGYQNPEELSKKILDNNSAVDLVQEKHLAVFDTALKDSHGRFIQIDGHLKMLAAIQPNISMGISKTVNIPRSCTVEDIERTYMDAWRLGIKSLAVYRDGSKAIQVYGNDETENTPTTYNWGERKPLPYTRAGLIHKFDLDGTEVYLSAGMYEDGRLGEIWMTANKHGATITGLLDSVAIAVSMALQHGAPLDHLASKFKGMKFSPAGFCEGSFYTSLVDYVFRWLEEHFPGGQRATEESAEVPPASGSWSEGDTPSLLARGDLSSREMCPNCGEFMIPNGVCQLCLGCGGTFGGCG